MGALHLDATMREIAPSRYPYPSERAAAIYVQLFIRAIGAEASTVFEASRNG